MRCISLLFQFTHPGKGATQFIGESRELIEFQFTHPGKGATFGSTSDHTVTDVSIHAPWEGCDNPRDYDKSAYNGFNSRTLGRVRLPLQKYGQIPVHVSIHAPWEGCDFVVRIGRLYQTGFNSRTLGRVRQRIEVACSTSSRFQFTHPGKGATSRVYLAPTPT